MNKINLILPWIVCVHLRAMETPEIYTFQYPEESYQLQQNEFPIECYSSPESPAMVYDFGYPVTLETLLEKTNDQVNLLPSQKKRRIIQWEQKYKELVDLLPKEKNQLENLWNQAKENHCTHPIVLFLLKAAQKKISPLCHKSSENDRPNKKKKMSHGEIISLFNEIFPESEELAKQAALKYAVVLPYNMKVGSLLRNHNLPLYDDEAKFQHFDGSSSKVSGKTPDTLLAKLSIYILPLLISGSSISLLDLSKLDLKKFPIIICQLPQLKVLVLNENNLTDLPQEFEKFSKLHSLIAFKNSFKAFPHAITTLPALEVLWLNNNYLEGLPTEITNLTTLKELDIAFNKLSTIPELPVNLTKLNIAGNTTIKIDSAINQLTSLQALKISDIPLSALPESLIKLSSLTYLNLEYCKLDTISSEISQLSNLETFLFSGNNFSQIPRELFSMPQLQKFSIGNDIWEKKEA